MNYVILAFGVFAVMTALILIFLDRIKGEDIYFNMDVKEQEIKKVIDDADEIITELNYTSEMVVKEIEEKMKSLRDDMRNLSSAAIKVQPPESAIPQVVKPTVVISGKKKMVQDNDEKGGKPAAKLNQKQQAVFEYASQGMSVTDIAKHMNIGQGEVMLILSLKNEVE